MTASAGRRSDCAHGVGDQRLTVLSHVQAGQSLSKRMVCATLRLALRHEITVLQQFRSVLLQKPLDRSRTTLVWSDVNVADACSHSLVLEHCPRTKGRISHLLTGPSKASMT